MLTVQSYNRPNGSRRDSPSGVREYSTPTGEVGSTRRTSKDLFHGKDGDLVGQDKESQGVSMLALHLLQSALVHVTLLVQQVLADPKWAEKLTDADRRALSPLFWTHVNPYGRFELDMNSRLDLDLAVAVRVPGPRRAQNVVAAAPV